MSGKPALETEAAQARREFVKLLKKHYGEVYRVHLHFQELQEGEEKWELHDEFLRDWRILHDLARGMQRTVNGATDPDLRILIAETAERAAGLANVWRARLDGNIEEERRKAFPVDMEGKRK